MPATAARPGGSCCCLLLDDRFRRQLQCASSQRGEVAGQRAPRRKLFEIALTENLGDCGRQDCLPYTEDLAGCQLESEVRIDCGEVLARGVGQARPSPLGTW